MPDNEAKLMSIFAEVLEFTWHDDRNRGGQSVEHGAGRATAETAWQNPLSAVGLDLRSIPK